VLQIIAVAGGGAVGALLRFWVSTGVYQLFGRAFPWGTLAVNVAGSFLMGLLFVLLLERSLLSGEWRAAVLVGLLGAFTTFSTFSIETLMLIEQADYVKALTNAVLSVLVCLFACWLGLALGRQL
jgi:CrcB protein